MNYMNPVKKIVGAAAERLGFTWAGGATDEFRRMYTFRRERDGVTEDICIDIEPSLMTERGRCAELSLSSDRPKTPLEYENVTFLLDRGGLMKEEDSYEDRLHFEDEAELRRILEHFVNVIEQKGEEVFSRLGAKLKISGGSK